MKWPSTPAPHERLLLFLPLAFVVGLFLLWPLVLGFLASFTNYSPYQQHLRFSHFANYEQLIEDKIFVATFRIIVIFAVVTVPTELLIGFGIANLLRRPFGGRGVIRVLLLFPWLISPVGNGVMWHFLFAADTGVLNYLLAWLRLPTQPSPLGIHGFALPALMIAEIWRISPLASFLLLPGLLAIPAPLWEFATLEGASSWAQIRQIALPLLRPLLMTIALLLIGSALGTFDSVLILTQGGPGTETLTPALYSYQKAFRQNDWPIGSTSAWFIVAVVLLAGAVYLALVGRRETE
jgi:multiple sugar transport system permease protein